MSLKRLTPRRRKEPEKNFGTPNPPNRGAKATRREVVPTIQGRTCEAEQSGIKATRRLSQEEIGELRQVTQGNGVGWARVQATSFRCRGDEVLKAHAPLGRVPQAAAGSVHTYGVQALPGHRVSFPKAGAAC